MPSDQQRKLIIILSAVLLAVIAVSGAVLILLPNNDVVEEPTNVPIGNSNTLTNGISDSETFSLAVLQRGAYKSLNLGVLQSLLPVRPPAPTGKANPFL